MTEPSAWDAYVAAVLRIEAPGGVLWLHPAPPASTSGRYPDPGHRPIHVITAHNPGGRVAPTAANALAQDRFTAELTRRGVTWWPADGGDAKWTHVEPGAAVLGMSEVDALALGAAFGQDAIFALTPAERRIVGCTSGRVTSTGWSTEPG